MSLKVFCPLSNMYCIDGLLGNKPEPMPCVCRLTIKTEDNSEKFAGCAWLKYLNSHTTGAARCR
jgi:hypothetical protein